MATKRYDESSQKYTYGPGGMFRTREEALQQADYKYRAVKNEYGDQIMETFNEALFDDGSGIRVIMTRVVAD